VETRGAPRRRLAVVAYYYPPLGGAGSLRALSFAVHLPAHGWDVTVFSPSGAVYGLDPSAVGEGLPGVDVLRTGTFEPRVVLRSLLRPVAGGEEPRPDIEGARVGPLGAALRSAVHRTLYFPDPARLWGPHLKAALRREHGKRPFDAVLSTSPPFSAHVACLSFGKRARVPVVLDFRDIPTEAILEPGGRHARLVAKVLPAAARVATVSGMCARWLEERSGGVPVEVVWNGFEPSTSTDAARGEPAGEDYLAYAGTVYDPDRQDLAPLLRCLRALRGEGVRLVLRVAGRVYAAAKEHLAPFEAEGLVRYEGFLPSADVPGFLRRSRAVVVWAWETPGTIGMSQAPVKFFDSLPLGRPILLFSLAVSEAEAVGREAGVASLRHADEAGTARVLRALVRDGAVDGLVPSGAATARFTRKNQVSILASILDRAAAGRGTARGS